MPAFLDSSAVVKYFANEDGSGVVRRLINGGEPLWVSELAFVECVSAIAKKVRKREIVRSDFTSLYRALVQFFASSRCNIVSVSDVTKLQAIHLLSTWGLERKITSADALQLANALDARALVGSDIEFYCADGALIEAATHAVAGLSLINPEAV